MQFILDCPMFYISNELYHVNLLCTIISEQIITVLGQAVWVNFTKILNQFLDPGNALCKGWQQQQRVVNILDDGSMRLGLTIEQHVFSHTNVLHRTLTIPNQCLFVVVYLEQ